MTPLTKVEKEKMLSRLFWDIDINQVNLLEMLDEKFKTIEDIQSQQFFSRLLTSCDWYSLLKLIPSGKLNLILNDPILNRLYPKDLRDKYIYARNVLSR